ncbi:MAG TPA: hypothetical protein DHW14_07795 [Clostridiales bacterium]|nr:hypothetical protein [Clostridiales bacterium]
MVETKGLSRCYRRGPYEVWALRDCDLTVRHGEFVSITGPSGSGKSTLLHLLGCLDQPTKGTYLLQGVNVAELSESRLAFIRNHVIGVVFQAYNLLPTLRAWQNVALPLAYRGVGRRERRRRALAALEKVGLADRAEHYPFELSGGEEQRVAIARAIVTEPKLLLADEPTGNLDSRAEERFMDIITDLHREGRTIIMVTHNASLARRADRVLAMRDGRLDASAGAA